MQTAKVASSFTGSALTRSVPLRTVRPFRAASVVVRAEEERLRLHNLSPWEGSRRQEKRKGRGHAAGQGGTCGFGNRGQKSRSGPGVRPGFEGGQTALYRRLPKLRGIAGGMAAGLPKYVVVNLEDLEKHFEAEATVTLQTVVEKGIVRISGRDEKLPLKVLGTGELSKPLNIKAAAFSGSAKEKITAAGGQAEEVAQKAKWTRKAYEKLVAEYAAQGKDYKAEQLKLKAKAKERKAKAAAKKVAA